MAKIFDSCVCAVALGIEFEEGGWLRAKGSFIVGILVASADLLRAGVADSDVLALFIGCLPWINLLNRLLCSCLRKFCGYREF